MLRKRQPFKEKPGTCFVKSKSDIHSFKEGVAICAERLNNMRANTWSLTLAAWRLQMGLKTYFKSRFNRKRGEVWYCYEELNVHWHRIARLNLLNVNFLYFTHQCVGNKWKAILLLTSIFSHYIPMIFMTE